MKFINNRRYPEDERDHSKDVEMKEITDSYWESNMTFVDKNKTGNATPDMQNPGLVCIKTTARINERDEAYLCYGSKKDFPMSSVV